MTNDRGAQRRAKINLLFLYAESPIHAGGPTANNEIDLPIQREVTTGLPVIWGQTLKGALRAAADDGAGGFTDNDVERVFGTAEEAGAAQGGAARGLMSVGDARLVLLPAPTLERSFAYTTTPLQISRLRRALSLAGEGDPLGEQATPVPQREDAALPAARDWGSPLVLADYQLDVDDSKSDLVGAIATFLADRGVKGDFFSDKAKHDTVVVSDRLGRELSEVCVDINPRVDLSGLVEEDGEGDVLPIVTKQVRNFWYEENLPAETLLVAVLRFASGMPEDLFSKVAAMLDDQCLVLGGLETTGKGLLWTSFGGSA